MIESRPGREARVRFWQPGGGYDRNIHSAAEIGEKIAYIHANPLRAKLVERLADWKWSSWRAWEYGVDDPLRIDRSGLPLLNE
jgi:putative transposase